MWRKTKKGLGQIQQVGKFSNYLDLSLFSHFIDLFFPFWTPCSFFSNFKQTQNIKFKKTCHKATSGVCIGLKLYKEGQCSFPKDD